MNDNRPLLSIEYYHKIKELYRKEVSKSQFIYFYTSNNIVQKVGFRYRKKNKFQMVDDVPHDELLLSRDKKLPKDVIVQVAFNPLKFELYEG